MGSVHVASVVGVAHPTAESLVRLAERLVLEATETCDHFPADPFCEDCAILAVRAALIEAARVARATEFVRNADGVYSAAESRDAIAAAIEAL